MNKEFLHMQKLAGLITESEYKTKLKEFDIDQIYQLEKGFGPTSTPKPPAASFMNKWNDIPPANKENLKKSTGKEPVKIWADSDNNIGNHLITKGSDNKYYLHNSLDGYKKSKGPFNSEEEAKKAIK